jgi:hypothetical protein
MTADSNFKDMVTRLVLTDVKGGHNKFIIQVDWSELWHCSLIPDLGIHCVVLTNQMNGSAFSHYNTINSLGLWKQKLVKIMWNLKCKLPQI